MNYPKPAKKIIIIKFRRERERDGEWVFTGVLLFSFPYSLSLSLFLCPKLGSLLVPVNKGWVLPVVAGKLCSLS